MTTSKVARKQSGLAVEEDIASLRHSGFRLGWQQFTALNKKNFLIRMRSFKTNLLLVLQAVLFISLIWTVDKAVLGSNQRRPAFSNVPEPHLQQIGSIPDCADNRFMRQNVPCYSLLYAPSGISPVEQIMAAVTANNNPPLPRNRVKGFQNSSEIDAYLMQNPETVLATIEFQIDDLSTVGFVVQTNSSVQWFKGTFQDPNLYIQLPVQIAVEREMTKMLTRNSDLSWNVSIVEFPHPSAQSPSLLGTFAPTFLFASIMFQFVLLLHDVVHEKESRVRRLMQTMGLGQLSLWSSWIMFEGLLAITETCLLVGFAYAFQFNLFTNNAFGLTFLLLLLTNFATISFGFMVAAVLKKASSSIPVGFFLFIVAWVFMIVIDFGFPYDTKYTSVAIASFSLFPWSLLSKGIRDLAAASEAGGGITWEDRSAYCRQETPSPAEQAGLSFFLTDCVVPLEQAFYILALQTVGYLLIAMWLENILPDEHGSRKSVLFFLHPRFWFPSQHRDTSRLKKALNDVRDKSALNPNVDIDVHQECDKMRGNARVYIGESDSTPPIDERKFAIEMFGLRKVYYRGVIRKRPFAAVKGNWLGIHEGECFCLLGPNGAGKSTTINCLTGVVPVTDGEAIVYSESIITPGGMERVRQKMGVCPQFDVHYDRLTGMEHLKLYASIKGLPKSVIAHEAAKLLEEVKLTEAATVTAGAYSGGMKRRLSVAMALLGDPKVVYLDEPTTGLDPISRRHLWDLIDKVKRGRCIILTTHSMEEADILGDRIGIMARGELRCLGNSLRLKSRFGSGYNVSIRVTGGGKPTGKDSTGPDTIASQQMAAVKKVFVDRLGIKSVDESLDYVHFLVPYEHEDKLPLLLSYLKSHANKLGIADIQMRLTPLEEVFLNVSRKAELEYAQTEGRLETLVLVEEKIALRVPVGADFIRSPAGHLYHIKWIQSESGALKLQDYYRDVYGNPELIQKSEITEVQETDVPKNS